MIFPSPAGTSLTNTSLAGKNLINPGQGVKSRLVTGKSLTFFYSVEISSTTL